MVAQIKATPAKTVPYIRELPLVGSLPDFSKDRLSLLLRMAQGGGDVSGCHFGPFPMLLFNKPEHVQSILVEHADDVDKGERFTQTVRPFLGNGILLSEGEVHRRQRKLMAPSFQPRHISNYAETMAQYAERLQQGWSDGTVIDVSRQMTALTMSIIGKVLFDAEVFAETDELGAAITIIMAHTSHILSNLFAPPLSWPTPRNRRTHRAIEVLRERMLRMIDARRSESTEGNDFLSILLRARDEDGSMMSNGQLMDECLTLFTAGHETTATTLTWAWYLLCQHPEVYQRVQDEVECVLQGRTPTVADLVRMPYCLQVMKETLRLYPPGYMIARAALRNIEIGGYQVRKGTIILVSPYTMQRTPEYFPEPEQFNPGHFSPEREKLLPRHAYLPFGAGPRICIGSHFALMEGHLLLATLAQRTTFTLVSGASIKADPGKTLTLRPNNAVKVVVKKR